MSDFFEASDEWGQQILVRRSEVETIREALGPVGDGRTTITMRSGTSITVKAGFSILAARLEGKEI